MFSILAIIITLLLLMFFAYRGYSVLILAPIMAILAVFLSGDFLSSIPAYTDVFMSALSGFLLKFFPIFLLGALFGQFIGVGVIALSIVFQQELRRFLIFVGSNTIFTRGDFFKNLLHGNFKLHHPVSDEARNPTTPSARYGALRCSNSMAFGNPRPGRHLAYASGRPGCEPGLQMDD